jgi:glycosyltransferase involved in cell wall biosynthesis
MEEISGSGGADRTRLIRVLHVIDSFDLGGAQEMILQFVTRCDSNWISNEVAALHGHGIYVERFRDAGIPWYSLSPSKFLPLYVLGLIWLIRRRNYDVIHCHLIASNLLAKPIAALCGVPVRINHDHTNDSFRKAGSLRMQLDRLANRFATHVCAVSASTRNFLLQHERLEPSKVTLIYNGADLRRYCPPNSDQRTEARKRHGLKESGLVIGGVGRLNYQKNFALFLKVAARLRAQHPDIQFILAGDGPERDTLELTTDDLGLRECVHFAGLVKDMTSLYPAIDILFMPSRFEGLPLTLLESMAMEIPAVASAVDGIGEIVDNGNDGILVPSGDAAGFERELDRLVSRPEVIRSLGIAARAKVTENFSCERMTAAVETLYRQYLQ